VEPVETDEEEGTVFSLAAHPECCKYKYGDCPYVCCSEEREEWRKKEEEKEEGGGELHHRPHRPVAHARVHEELGGP